MLGFGSGWKKGIWAGLLAVSCANIAFAAQSLRLAVVDGGVVHDATVSVTQEDGQVLRTDRDQGILVVKSFEGSNITISVTSPTHGTAELKAVLPADPDMGILLHLHGNSLRAEFMPASNLLAGVNGGLADSMLSDVQQRVLQTKTGVAQNPSPPPPGLRSGGDECVSAQPIACGGTDQTIVLGGGYTGNTNGAFPGDPVSSCEIAAGGPYTHDASWWYDFTLAAPSDVTFSMCTTTLTQDAVMALVDDCNNLTEIGCNDDFCDFPNFSPPEFTVTGLAAGNYKLVVQAYSAGYDAAVPFEMTVNCVPLGPAPYGACCDDLTSTCEDCVQGNCPPPSRFYANTTCADLDPPCGDVTGACCDTVVGGCTDATPAQCLASNGQYSGHFTTCATFVCPCVAPCPAGSTAEGEPDCSADYDDQFNGGCNSVGYPFSAINPGETVCGGSGTFTFGIDEYRDTDWYKITLAAYTQVTWTVEAEFPLLMGIVDTGGVDDCSLVTSFLTSATAGECSPVSVTECLGPGTWYLFVAPSVFNSVPCDRDYTATYTTAACPTGACCPGDGSCVDGQVLPQCNDLGGSFAGGNTTCAGGTCPANETCVTAAPATVPGSTLGNNTMAGNDVTPTCGTSSPAKGLWYTVVGTGETMTVSTCNPQTTFDTKIQVYCNCDASPYLLCVGGNDDGGTVACQLPSGFPYKSTFSWCSEAGHTYYVKVGGYSATNFGDFQLDVTSGGTACTPFVNCVPPTGACCAAGACTGTTTLQACDVLGGQWFTGQTCPAFSCPIPATNETCPLAINIAGVPYVATIDNNLSLPGGLPGDCNSGSATQTQNDIWWSYTPPSNCGLVLNVNPTTYDGIVNVYTGPDCNTLAAIPFAPDCTNDEPEPIAININAIGGTTYWFQVGDWGLSEGGGMTNFNLNCSNATGACCAANGSCSVTTQGACVGTYQGDFTTCSPNNCPQPPANDACLTPAPLSVPGSVVVSNLLATDDAESTATCTTGALNQAVWYTVVGNGSTYTATLCNAGGTFNDTKIQVWCNTCALPVCVGGNDDATCVISGLRSTVSWCTSVGTTYRIAIGGYLANAGTMELSVTSGAACGSPMSCAPAYCTSNATSTADSTVNAVDFNTISNSTAGVCDTYNDFTGISTTVQQGGSYPITITSGTCAGCYGKWSKAWIDYNQDLDFTDAGEQVFTVAAASTTCPQAHSGSVVIPLTATLGATRMRVVTREGGTATSTVPCGTYTWGGTEDYTVIIAPPSPPVGGPPFDDDDLDGVPNFCDNCPNDANADQADADNDGVGDPCDACPGFDDNADADGDGVANGCDACPGFDDNVDTDGDGTANGCDGCPLDPGKIVPGICGCGVPDTDSDGDGTADCQDQCPNDPNKVVPGICGCGVAETGDSDGDGVSDCVDQCPGVDDAVFFPGCQGAIPTMSHWGLVVLALLLLVLSKVYYGRRTATA